MTHGLNPGDRCPHCGQRIKDENEVWTRSPHQIDKILSILDQSGSAGLTANEADDLTGWGYQTTAPVMHDMRKLGLIKWLCVNRKKVRRETPSGKLAGVNVLAKHIG